MASNYNENGIIYPECINEFTKDKPVDNEFTLLKKKKKKPINENNKNYNFLLTRFYTDFSTIECSNSTITVARPKFIPQGKNKILFTNCDLFLQNINRNYTGLMLFLNVELGKNSCFYNKPYLYIKYKYTDFDNCVNGLLQLINQYLSKFVKCKHNCGLTKEIVKDGKKFNYCQICTAEYCIVGDVKKLKKLL